MTTTRTWRRPTALVTSWVAAWALALSLTWVSAGPAAATFPYDQVPTARHRILGAHLTNRHSHMETWIVGWYSYERRVRIHHRLRRKTFYGLRVSSQHCTTRRCWGPVVAGRLWSPHQPGRRAAGSSPGAHSDLCIANTTACAAPWNWFAGFVDDRQQNLVRLFVDPCSRGSLAGGGVVLTKNLSARILFEGGVITAARAASVFEGPPGVAIGALGGCMTGVGAKGFGTVSSLLDHLNPFDRGVAPRG